jgi:hypothetical protein
MLIQDVGCRCVFKIEALSLNPPFSLTLSSRKPFLDTLCCLKHSRTHAGTKTRVGPVHNSVLTRIFQPLHFHPTKSYNGDSWSPSLFSFCDVSISSCIKLLTWHVVKISQSDATSRDYSLAWLLVFTNSPFTRLTEQIWPLMANLPTSSGFITLHKMNDTLETKLKEVNIT